MSYVQENIHGLFFLRKQKILIWIRFSGVWVKDKMVCHLPTRTYMLLITIKSQQILFVIYEGVWLWKAFFLNDSVTDEIPAFVKSWVCCLDHPLEHLPIANQLSIITTDDNQRLTANAILSRTELTNCLSSSLPTCQLPSCQLRLFFV